MDIQVIASGSKGNAYRLSDGKTSLLLDAGIPFKELQIALNHGISSLTGALISHEHKDHCKAVEKLCTAGITCFMSPGTAEALAIKHHRIYPMATGRAYKIGSWAVMPFDTVHDAKQPYGFVVVAGSTTLLYATDTEYIKYQIKDLTHVMIECNYSETIIKQNTDNDTIENERFRRTVQSHMSLESVIEFFKANDLSKMEKVYLLHLSNDNSDAELFKDVVQQITNCEVIAA